MRLVIIGIIGLVCAGMAGLAFANLALLPKHEGYQSKGEFSYDRGEKI